MTHPHRIAVLTADVGEGHLAAAHALAEQVGEVAPDVDVVLVDALEALGPILRLFLLDAYRFQLTWTPWIFQALFWLFQQVRPLRALGRTVLATCGGRGLQRRLAALSPDIVVSTYPAATSVLGTLRRRGLVTVPALATITDFAGVAFWAHPSIDLHLVMHPALVPAVEREAGKSSARVVEPLVQKAFREPCTREVAREQLGLRDGRVVVVSGGGWGAGDIAGAVAEAADLADTTVIAVAGRNERLRGHLGFTYATNPAVRVLGFTHAMPQLLSAADVLVHTTGGVTCLEALTVGCPIVAYGAPPGHGPALAREMARLEIALHPRSRAELRHALIEPLAAPTPEQAPTAAQELLGATTRAMPATPRRRIAVGVTVAAALLTFMLASSTRAFALISSPFNLSPATAVPTNQPEVGLVVRTTAARAARSVQLIARRNFAASFAFRHVPPPALARLLAAHHDQLVIALPASGVDDWLGTADTVGDAHDGGYALAPPGGLSAGQYVLARLAGAHLIASSKRLERGAVVVATGPSLERSLATIRRRGLTATSVAALAVHLRSTRAAANPRRGSRSTR